MGATPKQRISRKRRGEAGSRSSAGDPEAREEGGSLIERPAGSIMNGFAVALSRMEGVGDVAVAGTALLVSMDDPDEHTPGIVRYLVGEGADVLRVAEIEHTLERAYLDLVSRADVVALDDRQTQPEAAA